MGKLHRVLLGAGSIALFANLALFHNFDVTGLVAFCFLFLTYLLFSFEQRHFNGSIGIFGATFVAYGILALTRASDIISSMLILGMTGCTMLIAYLLASRVHGIHSLGELLFIPLHLFASYLTAFFIALSKGFALLTGTKRQNILPAHSFSVLLGIFVTIPILLVLGGLLAQADPIFQKTVGQFFSFLSWDRIVVRVIVTVVLLLTVIPWGILSVHPSEGSPLASLTKKNAVIPLMIVMGSVCTLLLLFIVIQWPYVFANVGAETDLSKFGVATYSEYVKRGFNEFLMISLLLYSLLWAGLTAYRSHPHKEGKILFVIQTIGTVLFTVFIISVLRRVLLYWDFHGLSLIRVYGGLFLVLVFSLAITLYLRHISKFRLIGLELAGISAFLLVLGVWNAENFIIHNHPPTVNKQVDYVYLSRMSADGYAGWNLSYAYAQSILNNPELIQKQTYSKEERRDIAYAGLVSYMLFRHYNNLVHHYGSEADLRWYYTSLVENQRLQARLFESKLNTMTDGELSGIALRADMKQIARELSEVIGNYQAASSLEPNAMPNVSIEMLSIERLIRFTNDPCFYQQSRNSTGYRQYNQICLPSFYLAVPTKETPQAPDLLDQAFVWNTSEKSAFDQMKQEMPLEMLLLLQNRFSVMYYNMMHKRQGERDYPFDISLDAPLVESIYQHNFD